MSEPRAANRSSFLLAAFALLAGVGAALQVPRSALAGSGPAPVAHIAGAPGARATAIFSAG